MGDLISRQAAQTELMMKCERYTLARESHRIGHVEWSSDLISVADAMDAIRDLPSAQPELIEKEAYIRGFEQGRTQGMIDAQGGKKFATDAISRQDAIDAMYKLMNSWFGGDPKDEREEIKRTINHLPSAQSATNCSEIPNTSDFVSRKAVRDMVSAWVYDLMEKEDLNMALHDVDELPPVSAERQRGKKNEGYF